MAIKLLKVALYVRVSTQEQAKEGYSIGEQLDRLKLYAEAHGWIIVNTYTDAGYSGSNQNRPALQDLIKDVKAGKIHKVLVYKLDRLSRSQKDTLELIEDVFMKNNCDFESMTEKFDTSTSFGKAMIGILAVFAQLEREQIKERMSLGMEARIKEGKWKGGAHTPFGYDYEHDKLIINPHEAAIVKYIFNSFLSGITLFQIRNNMFDKGLQLRNKLFDTRDLKYILKNKTYCGYLKSKDHWYKGLHEPIIDEESYDKAQKMLADIKQKFDETGIKITSNKISSNFGGLIYCSHCGAKYCRTWNGSKKYGYHFYYKCYSRNRKIKHMVKDPNCKNKIYRIEVLDEMIFDEIRKLKLDPDYLKSIRKTSDKQSDQEQITVIEEEIQSINNQLSRFLDLYGLGKFSIDDLDKKTKQLSERKLKLQKALHDLQEKSKHKTDKEVMKMVESFDEVLKTGSLKDRRSIIEALIKRIDIDNDDITIYWNI